ncbi:MAG: hypothetical protein Q8L44_13875 [Sulfuritalea sp.]|nr:hypothetical protein [Sulfuritalea sp.]
MSSLRHLRLAAALALILQGCAGVPPEPPKIERLSAEQLAASLPQPGAAMPLQQIVALARLGLPAEELIGRIKQSGSRYRLSASQIVELAGQGVPLAVLDHMVASERTQIFDDMAAEVERREKLCLDRIEQELRYCRAQIPMQWFPGQHPFRNCLPPTVGAPHWRCF